MRREAYFKARYFTFSSLCAWFFLVSGCTGNKQSEFSEHLANTKGKHILVVINAFNRNPDVIEDWTDYKRYIWQQCETVDMSSLGIRDDGAYYLKPRIVCCNVEFEADRENIILGSKGLDVCPIKEGLIRSK